MNLCKRMAEEEVGGIVNRQILPRGIKEKKLRRVIIVMKENDTEEV